VKMTGKMQVTSIEIDPSLLKADEKEIVEDLLVAALADAKGKAENMMAEEMKTVTGGMPLPPGFGF
jgi:nucleoid-associated protein EbfC